MIYLKYKIQLFVVVLFFPDILDWNNVFTVVTFYFPKLFQSRRVIPNEVILPTLMVVHLLKKNIDSCSKNLSIKVHWILTETQLL